MSNILKLISDNAANRAVVSASPVAAGLAAASMLTDTTSQVCRATGTSLAIVLTWASAEIIGGVHLPWCNLSPSATMRVKGFSDAAGTSQVFDSGSVLACPWPAVKLLGGWTPATSASAYAYGGGTHARSWFTNVAVKRLEVSLVDVANLQGYIEVSRIFAGETWSPSRTADYNPSLTPGGTGTSFRDGAGGRRSTRGPKFRKLAVALSHMRESDRVTMWKVLSANGVEIPFLFSLYPDDVYPERERDYQLYGCRASDSAISRPNFADHATQLEMETM